MNISKIELTLKNGADICLLNDGQWIVKSGDRIYPLKVISINRSGIV